MKQKLKIIWLLFTDKKFFTRLKWVLQYSYRVSEKVRGFGCSDILLFEDYWRELFTENELIKMRDERDEFKISKDLIMDEVFIWMKEDMEGFKKGILKNSYN